MASTTQPRRKDVVIGYPPFNDYTFDESLMEHVSIFTCKKPNRKVVCIEYENPDRHYTQDGIPFARFYSPKTSIPLSSTEHAAIYVEQLLFGFSKLLVYKVEPYVYYAEYFPTANGTALPMQERKKLLQTLPPHPSNQLMDRLLEEWQSEHENMELFVDEEQVEDEEQEVEEDEEEKDRATRIATYRSLLADWFTMDLCIVYHPSTKKTVLEIDRLIGNSASFKSMFAQIADNVERTNCWLIRRNSVLWMDSMQRSWPLSQEEKSPSQHTHTLLRHYLWNLFVFMDIMSFL